MGTGIETEEQDMEEALKKIFEMEPVDANQYSPLTLAYLGDCVYEIVVRTLLVHQGNAPVDKLNRRASTLAKAATQAQMAAAVFDNLTEEEQAILKRGRNAKSYTMAKNATVSEYRRATGFETLIGWLYLKERYDRMAQIIRMGFEALDAEIVKHRAECAETE